MSTYSLFLNRVNPSVLYSILMHLLLLLIMSFGLPSFLKRTIIEPQVITVELLPITSVKNVKLPEPKLEAEKKPKEKKDNEPKPIPKPKEEIKPGEVRKKPKENPEEDFDSVLKNLEKELKQVEKNEKKSEDTSKDTKKSEKEYNPTIPLSISEKDAIMQQIAKCWTIPAGARDAKDMSVLLDISLEKDGTVKSVEIADKARYKSGDKFYQVMAESAVRAVRKCSPLKNLPQDKYDSWAELELNFDPKEVL